MIKALFVSNDPTLFMDGSGTRARMQAYAAALGELHIVSQASQASEFHEGLLHIYGVRTSRFSRVSALARRAHALILEHGIQVVSAQDPFEHGLAALRAVAGTGAKLHIQIHTDFLSPWFIRSGVFRSPQVPMPLVNRVRRRLADQVLPSASGIRVVSKRIKESVIARYGSRIPEPVVLPIAVPAELPESVPLPPHPAFTFALITVGRLEPEKRIEDILYVLSLIHDQYPAVGLVVVGYGRAKQELERRARRLHVEDKVLFLGDRPDAWGLMRSAQAYIQASGYEGYGRTLIEAALAGLPIITTDVGIVGEVFAGYQDVLAAPPGDPMALAVHIRAMLEDVPARTLLGMNAKAKAQAHLASVDTSPQAIAADLMRLV